MGSLTSLNGSVAFGVEGALGIGTSLERVLHGDKTKVHFIVGNQTVFQFDCSISENYSQEAAPTQFPIEDGSIISDHIVVAPKSLQLTGLVTDSPISDKKSTLVEGVTTATNSLLGPLGVVLASTAYAGLRAQLGTKSPSSAAFDTMFRLAAGDPTASPPTGPVPFDVVTGLRRYSNMVIKHVAVDRDSTTGDGVVFNVQLDQVIIVRPQSVLLSLLKAPAVAQVKDRLAEVKSKVVNSFKEGSNWTDDLVGAQKRYAEP